MRFLRTSLPPTVVVLPEPVPPVTAVAVAPTTDRLSVERFSMRSLPPSLEARRCRRRKKDGVAAERHHRLQRYGKRDRLLLWWLRAAAFQVGCVSPGQRLVHEAFWYGAMPPRPYVR